MNHHFLLLTMVSWREVLIVRGPHHCAFGVRDMGVRRLDSRYMSQWVPYLLETNVPRPGQQLNCFLEEVAYVHIAKLRKTPS